MKRLHGGAGDQSLLDFSENVNFLGPPAGVLAVLAEPAKHILRYPSADAGPLKEAVARRYGIPSECVLAGNGASELIYLVAALFRGCPGRVVTPAFTEYEDACEAFGIRLEGASPEVTFVGNPSSPEGRLRPRGEILELPGVRVVDEAFIDFAGERESLLREAASDSKLIVLRSLTKFYAIPGLRVGFAVSVPEVVRRLQALQPPWSVNALAQRAGAAALADRAHGERTLCELTQERERLRRELSAFGLGPLPSDANYLLCRVPDASALERALRGHGIAVRNCDSFTGLEKNRYLRFAVRKGSENERLLAVLQEICPKCPD